VYKSKTISILQTFVYTCILHAFSFIAMRQDSVLILLNARALCAR